MDFMTVLSMSHMVVKKSDIPCIIGFAKKNIDD